MSDSQEQQNNPLITIYANGIVRNGLEPMLQRAELSELCVFESHEEKVVILIYGDQEIKLSLPVRVGAILDQIQRISKKAKSHISEILDLGYGTLDTSLGKFTPADTNEKVVLLTEKEVEVLQYLHENADKKILRDELLESVWGYAKNTETHTLETHIYRLRQKIEKDPASPKLLKKDEDGYHLGNKVD